MWDSLGGTRCTHSTSRGKCMREPNGLLRVSCESCCSATACHRFTCLLGTENACCISVERMRIRWRAQSTVADWRIHFKDSSLSEPTFRPLDDFPRPWRKPPTSPVGTASTEGRSQHWERSCLTGG